MVDTAPGLIGPSVQSRVEVSTYLKRNFIFLYLVLKSVYCKTPFICLFSCCSRCFLLFRETAISRIQNFAGIYLQKRLNKFKLNS